MPSEFQSYPLLMAPYFSPRPWGGRKLENILGKDLPPADLIGESWELSDHPDGRSRIKNGPYAGEFLGDLYRQFPLGLCGVREACNRFPLLVKYIDAEEALSIQAHPADDYARAFGDRGKSECWYVMDCRKGAELIAGLKPGTSRDALREALGSQRVEHLVEHHLIHPGSFLYLAPGTIHAMLPGTLVCEIQQSSNLTYRVWDWDRRPARQLHLKEAGDVIDCATRAMIKETAQLRGEYILVRNEFFEVRLMAWSQPEHDVILELSNPHGLILNVVQGSAAWQSGKPSGIEDSGTFRLGETWFLPAGLQRLELNITEDLRLLVSSSMEL